MSDTLPAVGRGYCYEDLRVGFRFRSHRRTLCEADLAGFINLTWLTEELFAVADDSGRAIRGRPGPAGRGGAPIHGGDEVPGMPPPARGERGLVRAANNVVNQRGETVLAYNP